MRWLDAFGRWLAFDPAERQADRDRDVTPVDGGVPSELERLNEHLNERVEKRDGECKYCSDLPPLEYPPEEGWPGDVDDGEKPWDDAELIGRIARLGGDDPTPEFTERLIAELHTEGERLAEQRRRAITEGTGT